jgi:hypothetical protein
LRCGQSASWHFFSDAVRKNPDINTLAPAPKLQQVIEKLIFQVLADRNQRTVGYP